MLNVLSQLWRVCRLESTPQDLLYDKSALIVLVLANIALGAWQISLQQPLMFAFWQSLLMVTVSLVFIGIVLQIKNSGARFVQTATALIGIGVLLSLFIVPVLLVQLYLIQPLGATLLTAIASFLFLCIVVGINIWVLVITTHIFRYALDITFLVALIITLAYVGMHVLVYKTMVA